LLEARASSGSNLAGERYCRVAVSARVHTSKWRAWASPTLPSPGVSAVLSFFIPGLGQFYNGKFLRGIFWLIVTPGLWIGSAGTLGWICHVIAAYTAYSYAKDMR